MRKVILAEDKTWIIRSTCLSVQGAKTVRYYMTPAVWTSSPAEATIFRDYEAGEAHLAMYNERDKAPRGWADGRTEYLDLVPLVGALTTGTVA